MPGRWRQDAAAPPGRPDPRRGGTRDQTAAGASASINRLLDARPAREVGSLRRGIRPQQRAAPVLRAVQEPGVRGGRPLRLPRQRCRPGPVMPGWIEAVRDAAFELRSCGNGSKRSARYADVLALIRSSRTSRGLLRILQPDLPPGTTPGLRIFLRDERCSADYRRRATERETRLDRRGPADGRTNVRDREGSHSAGTQRQARAWGRGNRRHSAQAAWRSCGRQPSATTCAATSPWPGRPAASAGREPRRRHQRRLTCASRSVTARVGSRSGQRCPPGIDRHQARHDAETASVETPGCRQRADGLMDPRPD